MHGARHGVHSALHTVHRHPQGPFSCTCAKELQWKACACKCDPLLTTSCLGTLSVPVSLEVVVCGLWKSVCGCSICKPPVVCVCERIGGVCWASDPASVRRLATKAARKAKPITPLLKRPHRFRPARPPAEKEGEWHSISTPLILFELLLFSSATTGKNTLLHFALM